MICSRKLQPFESYSLNSNEYILFSLETENSSVIPSIVDKLKKAILGFNYKIQDNKLIYKPGEIIVHSLPKYIKTCQDSCVYCDQHLLNDYSKGLASIAVNDKIITITAAHMLYDGGFFVDLYNRLFNDTTQSYYYQSDPQRFVTYTFQEMFEKEYQRKDLKFLSNQHTSYSKYLQSIHFSTKIDSDVTGNPRCISHVINIPASEFQFQKSKMSLSDMYWTMLPLTCMAFNGSDISDNFGVLTCVDMRKFLSSQKVSRLVGQNFSELFLTIGEIKPEMTIRQVGKMFRHKFNEMKNNGTFYGALYNMDFGFPTMKNRLFVEISNIGRFEANKSIADVFIQQSANSKESAWIAGFASFSRNMHGKNTVNIRFARPQTALNHLDGEILTRSFAHSMTEIPPDVSIIKAFDEIRAFQSKVRQQKV